MDQAIEQVVAFVPGGRGTLLPSNVLGCVVVTLSLWHAVMPSIDEVFALVPHHTVFSPVASIPTPYLWNVLTAHFFEANLLKALVAAPCVVVLARMLERLWSVKEFALHVCFTAACSGFSFFALELIHVWRTHHEKDFFLPVRGCIGLLVTIAVGLRHAYPLEAVSVLPRSLGIQCQHLPFGLAALFTLIGFAAPPWVLPEWSFAPLALFFGWLHVRYLMWFPYQEVHGDHSPDFTFAALFPQLLRPLVSCLGAVGYAIGVSVVPGFVRLRQVEGDARQSIVYDPTQGAVSGSAGHGEASPPRPPGPTLDPAAGAGCAGSQEYNDRRSKALQLLDESINSLGVSMGNNSGKAAAVPLDKDVDDDFDLDAVLSRLPLADMAAAAAGRVATSLGVAANGDVETGHADKDL